MVAGDEMELLQLRYFYESARQESFAKTAEKYMVPASSVSASVKRLEKELRVELFDRSANQIRLNEKGHIFAEKIGEILRGLEDVTNTVSETKLKKTEISILIKARRRWIADLIVTYKKTHPDIHFRVSHDASITDFGSFDIIIDEQSKRYDGWDRYLISVEEICVKAAKSSPLAGRELTFSQLREQSFIVPQIGCNMWRMLQEAGKRAGFTPRVAIESNDLQCMLHYVEVGMGLSLGSRRALLDESEKNITELHITDFNEAQCVYVYYRRLAVKDRAVKEFCSFLRSQHQI